MNHFSATGIQRWTVQEIFGLVGVAKWRARHKKCRWANGALHESELAVTSLSMLTLMAAIGSCPNPPSVGIQLMVERGSVAVSSGMSLADIYELGGRAGQSPPHPILGFSASSFYYTVQEKGPSAHGCKGPITVRLSLVLEGRSIGIAREVMGKECLGAAAMAHCRLHASADDQTFTHLTSRVGERVRLAAFQTLLREQGHSVADVEHLLKSAVQDELPAYDEERRRDQAAVDTPAQVAALVNACSSRI